MCSTLAIFRDLQVPGQEDDRVVAAVGLLANDVVQRIDEIDIVAAVAGHAVAAAAAVQNVGAVVADQDVVIPAADAVLDVIVGPIRVVSGEDRHIVAVAVDAGELSGAQVEDRARRRAGEVDRVGPAGVMDHEADVMLQARGGQLVAILRAAEAVDIVAGVEVDVLIGAHAVRVDGREEAANDGLDVGHQRRRRGPAAGFADVDPIEIGHDAVLLAIVGPGRIVQIVDLHAAGTAVIVEPGMVQAEFMAEFMDEGIEDIAADIRLVGFRVVETLADADITIGSNRRCHRPPRPARG